MFPVTDNFSFGLVVPIPKLLSTKSCEVEARPPTENEVVVALVTTKLVEVAFTVTRFVIVEVELLTKMPPESVAKPEMLAVPVAIKLAADRLLAIKALP